MELPKIGTIEAFAMIVDINSFTPMVSKSAQSDSIAQFVRDALSGGIDMVQKHGGSVVSFMGDALACSSLANQAVDVAKDMLEAKRTMARGMDQGTYMMMQQLSRIAGLLEKKESKNLITPV